MATARMISTPSRGASSGDVYVAFSTNFTFAVAALWHDDFCYNEEVCTAGDFDGDGKDDIVAFTRQGFGDTYVALSTGVNFGAGTLWFDDFCYGDEVCTTGDFDGDGMDDLVAFTRSDSGDVYVSLSTGSAFALGTLWNTDFCYHDEVCTAGNFDGEGGDDIVTFLRQENPTLGRRRYLRCVVGNRPRRPPPSRETSTATSTSTPSMRSSWRDMSRRSRSRRNPDARRSVSRITESSGAGQPLPIFGDVDCDSDVDAVDALKVLRHVAGLAITQTEPCPDIGAPT